MDISDSLAPKSDQLNADDLVAHPVTVTIAEVTRGNLEQPYNFELVEYPGRPYKPGKSMRRVIVEAWGSDATTYTGRKLTLYRDPNIKFGPDVVGGIRISHMSHLDKPKTIPLTVTRGKRKPYTVQPLIESDNPWIAHLNAATNLEQLAAVWKDAGTSGATRYPAVIAAKDTRKKALGG